MRSIESLRKLARKVKKRDGITYTAALDFLARELGCLNWAELMYMQRIRIDKVHGRRK